MPIHEKGLDYPGQDGHPLFAQDLWRSVLMCFTEMEAIQLDTTYGGTQTAWMIRDRMVSVPGPKSWVEGVTARSLGMLIYLQRYKVPCTNMEDIIQYAVDYNLMGILLFFTCGEFEFVDLSGLPIKVRSSPFLDRAVRRNYLDLVRYCLVRFNDQKSNLLRKSPATVERLMRQNAFEMLQLIVPHLTQIVNWNGVKWAVMQGFRRVVRFALDQMDPLYITDAPPRFLLVDAAAQGHLKILKLLAERVNGQIPLEAYRAAFNKGQVEVCIYIRSLFPEYLPLEKDLVTAAGLGHFEVFNALPPSVYIPDACFEQTVALSGNHKLLTLLSNRRPTYDYTKKLVTLAIQSGHCDMVILIFKYGELKKLNKKDDITMVTKHMHASLAFFHNSFKEKTITYNVYNVTTFLEAARICDLPIMKAMLESKSVPLTEANFQKALASIYVSSENSDTRLMAYTFVEKAFQNWKLNPPVIVEVELPPTPPPKKRKSAEPLVDEADLKKQRRKKNLVSTSQISTKGKARIRSTKLY